MTEVAFGVATNPATTQFEAFYGGNLIESFSAATSYDGTTNSFFGFSGITFDEIRVTVGGDEQILIDNIQMGSTVPEPASLILLGTGLGAIGLAAWRRRK